MIGLPEKQAGESLQIPGATLVHGLDPDNPFIQQRRIQSDKRF
jgi:hypothetical protein